MVTREGYHDAEADIQKVVRKIINFVAKFLGSLRLVSRCVKSLVNEGKANIAPQFVPHGLGCRLLSSPTYWVVEMAIIYRNPEKR